MAARPLAYAFLATLSLAATPALAQLSLADAASAYQVRCATCHGDKGQGTRNWGVPPTGPALKNNPFIVSGSPAAIRNVIRKGRSGTKRLYDDAYPNMPSFGPEAVPDVDGLVAYLRGPMQTAP